MKTTTRGESPLSATPCSLSLCPSGTMTAKLPYFREKPLPVQVDHWTALDGTLLEKTVRLLQGSIKDRYLSDSELDGAEFYPENSQDQSPQGG